MKSATVAVKRSVGTEQDTQAGLLPFKRLFVALTVAFTFLASSFYGLIPDIVSSRYILMGSIAFGLIFLMIGPRPTILKTGFVLASLSLSLALIDLAMRPVMEQRLFGPSQMFMYRWPPMSALWRYKPNVFFDGVVYGDLATRDYQERRREVFRTDSYGFRNTPAQELESQQGRTDLVLLGDSFGVGVGTTQGKTWGALFQSKYGLRTYNLSMAASGPWHELMNLKIACQRLHCGTNTTVLWVLFAGNDLQDEIYDQLEPAPVESWFRTITVSIATFRNMSPIRNIVELVFAESHPSKEPIITRYLPDGRKLIFRKRYEKAVRLKLDEVRQHPHYRQVVAVMEEMKRFSDVRHFSVFVVVAPAKEEIYAPILYGSPKFYREETSGFAEAVEEICRKNGMSYLDLTPFFVQEAEKQLARGNLLWWSDDTHWNERGHEFAAAVVHDHLSGLVRHPAYNALPVAAE